MGEGMKKRGTWRKAWNFPRNKMNPTELYFITPSRKLSPTQTEVLISRVNHKFTVLWNQ